MNYPRFNALCEAARGRGLHTELHVSDLKTVPAEHRELVLVKVGADRGTVGRVRLVTWETLDREAEALHEELAA